MSCFLFDLDMTLVDTDPLQPFRKDGRWDRALSKVIELSKDWSSEDQSLPPWMLPKILKSFGHQIGIVTSSPKNYAEAIINRFGIQSDILIAYGDTERHKPDPEPIEEALRKLGCNKDQEYVFYVGNEKLDFEAAFKANVISIGVGWFGSLFESISTFAPDIFVRTTGIFLQPNIQRLRYLGEAVFDKLDPVLHEGSVLSLDRAKNQYALGRYFKSGDSRHQKPFSSSIIDLKNHIYHSELFAKSVVLGLDYLREYRGWMPEYILSIPPKINKPDRFNPILQCVSQKMVAASFPKVLSKDLLCVKEIPDDYKHKSSNDKKFVLRGAYQSQRSFQNSRILLIDDVLTTGITFETCQEVLLKSGAQEVYGLALSLSQPEIMSREVKECPRCGNSLVLRENHSNGSKFWGCSAYKKNGGCLYTESYLPEQAAHFPPLGQIETGTFSQSLPPLRALKEDVSQKIVLSQTEAEKLTEKKSPPTRGEGWFSKKKVFFQTAITPKYPLSVYLAHIFPLLVIGDAFLSKHPYSFYIMLRWICSCSFLILFLQESANEKQVGWKWTFGLEALLYNPIVIFHFSADTWEAINDVTVLGVIMSFFRFLPRKSDVIS
ncbi:MAG: DUF6804 family protein [Leptospirales bacterium]